LTKCFDLEKNKLLSILVVQIISVLLTDPLNVDYITEECFEAIHSTIKMHPVLKRLNIPPPSNRTKRLRAAALLSTDYKSHLREEENEIDVSLEQNCISRALDAMSTIVVRQQAKMEEDLGRKFVEIKEVMIEERKDALLFHKTGAIETIERLVPSLLIQMESNRNEQTISDMYKCIKMLERSGLYKKYSMADESTHEAWNMLLPSLIRCLQCLSTSKYEPLRALSDKRSTIECTVTVLTFLTNITNKNEDACNRIVLENGILTAVQVLISNDCVHFDITTLCFGFLSNITEENWNARDILKDLKLPAPYRDKKFIDYIAEKFSELYHHIYHNDTCTTEQESKDKFENAASKQTETERLVIVSYISIFIGCLIRGHKKNEAMIQKRLPNKSFECVILILHQFLVFQSNARVLLNDTYQGVNTIINELRAISETSSC
jgi:hypothetical protein